MPTIRPSSVRSRVTVLSPRLGTRRMQQLVALALKFAASRGDGCCVLDLELD